jgi:O-acetyl-ADP-ribose deacetylase (regulator of RNase III)
MDGVELTAVHGDITVQEVDAIVNAANSSLMGGGGVDGAIHAAGGPQILAACREVRRTRYRSGLTPGYAVATIAGRLPAKWVIHTVGPVWNPHDDNADILRRCYVKALRIADELGARSVAFPLISAGVFRWPLEDAARQAVAGIRSADTSVDDVRLILYSPEAYAAARRALREAG